jgi:hypothetical protein
MRHFRIIRRYCPELDINAKIVQAVEASLLESQRIKLKAPDRNNWRWCWLRIRQAWTDKANYDYDKQIREERVAQVPASTGVEEIKQKHLTSPEGYQKPANVFLSVSSI